MASNPSTASLERQYDELRDQFEEFKRQVAQNTENRNAEIGTLRESLSAAVSAADRDAATVDGLATRLGAAEASLTKPPAPVNWVAIFSLVLASAGTVAGLGNWALGSLKEGVEQLAERVVELRERQEHMGKDLAVRNDDDVETSAEIAGLRDRLREVEIAVDVTDERVNALSGRVTDIDRLGPRVR